MIPILYIMANTQIAGSEKELLMVLKYTNRQQFCPYIWVHDDGPLYHTLKQQQEKVFIFRRLGRLDPLYYLRLLYFLKRYKIQIMVVSNRIPGILGKFLGIRTIQRSNQPIQKLGKLGRLPLINTFLYWGIDCVICVSQSIAENILQYEKISPSKLVVVYNGIELDNIPKREVDTFRKQYDIGLGKIVGFIGRFHPQKGIDYLLEAIPLILSHSPDCWFVFCGSGEEEARLKEKTQQLQIQHRVRFLGYQSQALEILSCFDISVMPSRWEGFPFVALETFSQQKPLVATRVGGVPELVHEGNGVLVPPENAEALAQGIWQLLKDPVLAEKLARSGYETVCQKFAAPEMAKNTEKIYLDVLTNFTKKEHLEKF